MRKTAFLLTALLALASCADFDDATTPIGSPVTITLQRPDKFVDASSMAGRSVTLKTEGQTITVLTDAMGKATFSQLTPNIYNISAAWELSHDDFVAMTGGAVTTLDDVHKITVSGSLANQKITEGQDIVLPMLASENQDIIIGKIYYATSKDNNNRNYDAGTYLELYNQANDTVDVAGLYIGLTESENTQPYTLENLHEQHADSVILLKQLFRIPADTAFRVAPGGTVVIANSAIDHTQNNTSMESDLSGADFEAKDASGKKFTNNPDVPALQQLFSIYKNISWMNFVTNGLCGVVIIKTDEDINTWKKTYKYPNTDTKGFEFLLCHKRVILDGVECLPNKSGTGPNVSAKRLFPDIDASYINITAANGRSGEVVYRKTSERTGTDGHHLLIDTNNSGNDFQVSTTIKPRQYDEISDK
ncbi:MAG: DUF4876 domain-containing protein [Prevotella sp.]|nr:DUF4876 domain-containing protein [Prevotella sp.]